MPSAPDGPKTVASFETFLTTCPPGSQVLVLKPFVHNKKGAVYTQGPGNWELKPERLFIFCATCEGERWFDPLRSVLNFNVNEATLQEFLWWRCGNCRTTSKMFAVEIVSKDQAGAALCAKVGEDPPFGRPLPGRLLTLLRESEDLLSAARRCENQSMGIGAFVYYRRVLDNQRGRLFDEIIKAAETLGGFDPLIEDLKAAKAETRFSESVEAIKHALPESLLVKGQNPLSLLHNALSDGLHAQGDATCLAKATAIRTVLTAFAERLHSVIAADDELAKAVGTLSKASAVPPES